MWVFTELSTCKSEDLSHRFYMDESGLTFGIVWSQFWIKEFRYIHYFEHYGNHNYNFLFTCISPMILLTVRKADPTSIPCMIY